TATNDPAEIAAGSNSTHVNDSDLAENALAVNDPADAPDAQETPNTRQASPAAVDRPSPPGPWRRWLAAVIVVRDTLASLPPIPPRVWIFGAALLIVARVLRMAHFRHRIRRSAAAPPEVARMVRQAARRVGLTRVPETLIVRDRVSPMIWCGRTARLI